ncbi:MAG: tetratricopeptide repeat protein [Cyclobacteriaceae bacterium]
MIRALTLIIIGSVIFSCSKPVNELYEQATLRFDADDFEGAIRLLDSVIALDGRYADAYHTRGSSKFNLEDFEGAIADYSMAIELTQPKVDAELYYFRGDAYFKLNQHENALSDFSMAVTIIPDYAEAFNLRADTWMSYGNADSALIDYNRSINANSRLAGPHFGLANYYSNVPDYNQAIAHYSQAIELGPKADYYFNRGLVFYLENDFENAISDFTNTIELDDQYAEAFVLRGTVKDEAGMGAEALLDFDEAIRLDPANGSAYFNRGITRKSQGDLAGACQDFNKALELGYLDAIAKTGDCPSPADAP